MAKVKILEPCAGLDFAYSIGEEVEENEHTQGLINAGLAECVETPTETPVVPVEPVEPVTPSKKK